MPASARPRIARRMGAKSALVGLISYSDEAVLIRFCGEIVGHCFAVVRSTWNEALSKDHRQIELDLSGVTRWDLLGLAALIEACAGTPRVRVSGTTRRLAMALSTANSTWQVAVQPSETVWIGAATALIDSMGQVADSVMALLVIVLIAPLLILVALAVALDSPGPVFFTQERTGRRDRSGRVRVIRIFKFRTMVADAEAQRELLRQSNLYGGEAFFKLAADPRITRIGSMLRAWSLDELPQLLNVAAGDMRLVGNRPLPLDEARSLREPWQRLRFLAPVGVTGLWQISGRSEVPASTRMAMDTAYAVGRSSFVDLAILIKTLPAVFEQRGR